MALTLADIGASAFLNIIFNKLRASGDDFTLKLATNSRAPSETDSAGSWTEAESGGYAAKTLTVNSGQWVVSGDAPAAASHAQQTYTFTGSLNGGAAVEAYYVVDADGTLLWGEKVTTFTPANSGDQVKITPLFELSKGTPT